MGRGESGKANSGSLRLMNGDLVVNGHQLEFCFFFTIVEDLLVATCNMKSKHLGIMTLLSN